MSIWSGLDYKETFILNSIRVFFASIVIFIGASIAGAFEEVGGSWMEYILAFLLFPWALLIIYWILVPIGLFLDTLSDLWVGFALPATFIGLFLLAFSMPGDPLYFLAGRVLKLVPISPDFGPLNFTGFFKILRKDAKIVHVIEE